MRELNQKITVAGMACFFEQTRREAGMFLAYVAARSGVPCTRDRLMDTLVLTMLRLAQEQHACLLAVHMKMWACGPVQPDLYADLCREAPVIMKDWLVPFTDEKGRRCFRACREANLADLGETRAEYVRRVTAEAAAMSDEALHEVVAGPGSLWERIAGESGYLRNAFEKGYISISDDEFDPAKIIPDSDGRYEYDLDWMEQEEHGLLSE